MVGVLSLMPMGFVLILVVMEEGQRHMVSPWLCLARQGLNPCCNGRGSKTQWFTTIESVKLSLNPCCNGRGSKTYSCY